MTAPPVSKMLTPQADRGVSHFVIVIVLFTAIFILWFSAGDHSLYPPDEGRYGSVSLHMAEGGSWLVPVFEGKIHLTKPPMIYWLQAVSIRMLGRTELAVRLPGLMFSLFVILLLYQFARKAAGVRVALIAVGGLAVTPMFVLVSRLAVIDPLLDFFWFSVLVFGYQAVNNNKSLMYTMLMWVSLVLGLFAKGPVALVPIGILMVWVLMSGRHSFVRSWKLWAGVPLAFVPLIVWAFLVMKTNPDAWQVWKHELLDRAAGSGAHNEPVWYYAPIIIAGFFPLSALMPIPGWNLNVRYAWSQLRSGSLQSLLLIAIFFPFVIFSLISGKLMTYMLPIGPPFALLVAFYLNDAVRGASHPGRSAGVRFKRQPVSMGSIALGAIILAVGAMVAAYLLNPDYWWMTIPFVLSAALAIMVRISWNRHPTRRGTAIVLLWMGATGLWLCVEESENIITAQVGARQFARRVQALETNPSEVATYGFNDPTLSFYLNRDIPEYDDNEEVMQSITDKSHGSRFLLAEVKRWDRLRKAHPETASRFIDIESALASRNRRVYILKLRN